ncbi:MAG: hypothetical protein H7123_06760 [Thermoleophilia bacterium]|nr:hypothetical protein [Thermoleophilia bacterium]
MSSKRTDRRRAKAQRHPEKTATNLVPRQQTKKQEERDARASETRAVREREREFNERKTGPLLRIRHASPLGLLTMYLGAWLLVGLIVVGAEFLQRWNTMGYPDSLWLYIAIGGVAVAPVVGRVALTARDTLAWAIQIGFVALGALIAEAASGPTCTPGNCDAIGARGTYGPFGAVILVMAAVALTWWFGRLMFDRISLSRPRGGRVRVSAMYSSMLVLGIVIGLPLAGTLLALGLWARPAPSLASKVKTDVANFCFDITEPRYQLDVRAYPGSEATFWKTFLVRRSAEHRPTFNAAGKAAKLPSNWTTAPIQPYEALVTYQTESKTTDVQCRLISPSAGNATTQDANPADSVVNDPTAPGTLTSPYAVPPFSADPKTQSKTPATEQNPLSDPLPAVGGGGSPNLLTDGSAVAGGTPGISGLPAGLNARVAGG